MSGGTDGRGRPDQRDKPPRRAVVGGGAPIVRERRRAVWQEMVCNCESRGDPHRHASPKPRGTYTVAGREGACACTHSSPTRAWGSSRPPPPAWLPHPAPSLPRAPPPSLPLSLALSLFPSFLLSHSLSPPLYSLSPPLSQQKINKKVAKQTNTETASTAAHGTRRKPRCCGRCRLHGVDVRAEGHQGSCPHVKCGCKPCVKLAGSLSRYRERSRPLKRRREVRRV